MLNSPRFERPFKRDERSHTGKIVPNALPKVMVGARKPAQSPLVSMQADRYTPVLAPSLRAETWVSG